jgi:flagellar protein FliO/FliZ
MSETNSIQPPSPSMVPSPSPSPNLNAISFPTSTSTLSLTGTPASLPSSSSFSPGPLAAGLFLALLAAATLVMARRRKRATRLISILESVSLGPKRALVVARLGDELLVLGSSEGGIALLSTRPAAGLLSESTVSPPPQRQEFLGAEACPPLQGHATSKGGVLDLFSRLKARARPSSTPPFDALLTESLEDVELRRKLAAGFAAQAGPRPQSRSRP